MERWKGWREPRGERMGQDSPPAAPAGERFGSSRRPTRCCGPRTGSSCVRFAHLLAFLFFRFVPHFCPSCLAESQLLPATVQYVCLHSAACVRVCCNDDAAGSRAALAVKCLVCILVSLLQGHISSCQYLTSKSRWINHLGKTNCV